MAAPAAVHERGGVARTAAHAAAHCSGSASHAARPRASLRCRLPRSARPRVRRRRRRARTRAQHPAARHPARAAAPRNSPARACTHTRSRRSGALAPRLLSGARTSHKKMLYSHDLCFASKHARKRCFQPNQLRTRFLAVLASWVKVLGALAGCPCKTVAVYSRKGSRHRHNIDAHGGCDGGGYR